MNRGIGAPDRKGRKTGAFQRLLNLFWDRYPRASDGVHVTLATARKDQIVISLNQLEAGIGQKLELKDLGSETEPVQLIHPSMYEAIKSADIIIADLSGLRPNVFAEAGFALQHLNKGRLVFLFHPHAKYPKVPFDLASYTRVEISDAGEIPGKLVPVLKGILEKAARGEI